MNFSDEHKCIYENGCPFARSFNLNIIEASETCEAIVDVKDDDFNSIEDILQDIKLRELLSTSRQS